MVQGVIIKALSGFYYVAAGDQIVECKARGRFRYDGCSPLVGDRVEVSFDAHGKGRIDTVLPRRNAFIRPAVANIDQLIMIAANVNPVTDPFLIDRVVAIAENAGFMIGTISLKKIPYSVAPSIRPASINDFGSPKRYCRKKKIVDACAKNGSTTDT